ncbi:amine sulfotransferase-like isoform X3 [Amblyomma americanum]
MATDGPKPFYQIIDGIRRCPFITPESLRQGLDFVARKGDLLQVSYPRSGTHWVQYITQLILNEGEPVNTYEQFAQAAVFVEYRVGAPDYEANTPVRTFCTHLPPSREKLNPEAKYIYVARNPWDVCVSLYHHINGLTTFRFGDGTFDDFLEAFLNGELGYGDYFEHVRAGYSLKDEPNVFFVTYEQLKKDTRGTVLRLAGFIGDRYGNMLEEGDEGKRLLQILERSSAENMKKVMTFNLRDNTDPVMQKWLNEHELPSKPGDKEDLKRQEVLKEAKVGCWKTYFSPHNLRRMDVVTKQKTRGSDVMELWADIRQETLSFCERSD